MNQSYALIPDRVKAAFVDGVILIVMMYAAAEILELFELVSDWVRIALFLMICLLYDPWFTSAFGGTIGHSFSGISVAKDSDNGGTIGFPIAIVRFVVKTALGWVSLLTVTGNEKQKALHDYVAKSVVVQNLK